MTINKNNQYIRTLASCPLSTKQIGDNVTLTLNITQGQEPYIITYKKDGVTLLNGVQTLPTIGTSSYVYTTATGDEGTHIFTTEVTDDCNPPQIWSDQCSVTISSLSCPILTVDSITIDGLSCPSSLTSGLHSLSSTVSGGQLPLSYEWSINGVTVSTNPTFDVNFGDGLFNIVLIVRDSCSPQQSQSSPICSINMTSSCLAPTCNFTVS